MRISVGKNVWLSTKAALLATVVAATLFAGSGPASADPQTITITADCSGGEMVTVTTLTNNAAGLVFVDGTLPDGSKSVGVVLSESSTTLGVLRTAPPGFDHNGVPTTTCTFTIPTAPQLGTFTVEVLFTTGVGGR